MFNEPTLSEKQEFYRNLNEEDITDADNIHAKRVCKDFEIENLGKHHDLYLKSDTLLLAVFKNLRKLCLNIQHLVPAKSLSAPVLAWQVTLEKTEVKFELLTKNKLKEEYVMQFIDMLKLITSI